MSQINSNCDDCNQEIIKNIGQTVIDHQLRFYLSYQCPFCGAKLEIDDIGFASEDLRKIFLQEQGKYQLTINLTDNTNKIIAIKIVRHALQISISEVGKLFDDFPVVSNLEGTKVEMEWLQGLLLREKVNSLLKKA